VRGRGAGWVVAQSVLLLAVVALCVATSQSPPRALVVAGIVLMIAGAFVAVSAARTLGRSLTPFPKPKESGELETGGPFRIVRHPIYAGLLVVVVGASLTFSLWALVPSVALAVLWSQKARVEENHLARSFPAYAEYRSRVRARLIPFVY